MTSSGRARRSCGSVNADSTKDPPNSTCAPERPPRHTTSRSDSTSRPRRSCPCVNPNNARQGGRSAAAYIRAPSPSGPAAHGKSDERGREPDNGHSAPSRLIAPRSVTLALAYGT